MVSLSKKEQVILSELRKNARTNATKIARMVDIPVTTLYNKLRTQLNKGIIVKHTTIIDFEKIGYPANSLVLFEPTIAMRNDLKNYLTNHPNINTN